MSRSEPEPRLEPQQWSFVATLATQLYPTMDLGYGGEGRSQAQLAVEAASAICVAAMRATGAVPQQMNPTVRGGDAGPGSFYFVTSPGS